MPPMGGTRFQTGSGMLDDVIHLTKRTSPLPYGSQLIGEVSTC